MMSQRAHYIIIEIYTFSNIMIKDMIFIFKYIQIISELKSVAISYYLAMM